MQPDPIQYALLYVPTFAAVLLRVGAMFVFAPLFGSGRIPRKMKAMMALVLAACIAGTVKPVVFPPTIFTLVAAMTGEILFGLVMGMTLSFTFVAAQWAGEIIGQQLGFSLGAVFDPQYGGAGSVVSDLLYMLTLCVFLSIGGHHAMLIGMHKSIETLPLFAAGITTSGLDVVAGLLTSCTVLTMKLVAPIIVAMMVTDIILGFVSKTMPQLNVMSMGMNLKSLLGRIVLSLGMMLTSDTMRESLYARMLDLIDLYQKGL